MSRHDVSYGLSAQHRATPVLCQTLQRGLGYMMLTYALVSMLVC
jgi:hypothetical protein